VFDLISYILIGFCKWAGKGQEIRKKELTHKCIFDTCVEQPLAGVHDRNLQVCLSRECVVERTKVHCYKLRGLRN